MSVFDNKGNYTADALNIGSKIGKALEPILENALSNGMSHSDFCYMVNTEVELLILTDLRHKRMNT